MKVLEVENLCKVYEGFALNNVCFSLEEGKIMGFIGRNGAGKTTTLRCIQNLAHPSSGTVRFFGLDFAAHETDIKADIGYASGGAHYYLRKTLKEIVSVTKTFYENWDEDAYRRYMARFALNENKRVMDLSEGMKVKFNLVLALSHKARLLLLDEPTSGLDPVSRDELLEIFLDLAGEGVAILFSTHITSDLEKCADIITYMKQGSIVASKTTEDFINTYRLVHLPESVTPEQEQHLLGVCCSKKGNTGLVLAEDARWFDGAEMTLPDLQDIMGHLEKNKEGESHA